MSMSSTNCQIFFYLSLQFMIYSSLSAKTLQKPANWEKRTGGGISYEGLHGQDLSWVPPLVGQNILDPKFELEMFKGSHFTFEVIKWEKSQTLSKGYVISQDPMPYVGVKKEGVIKLIVSSGK